jgi:HTH-type transcriptional regulator/antitoxin HigA
MMKYFVIKSVDQYQHYSDLLIKLLETNEDNSMTDEIELLTVLMERWETTQLTQSEHDPVAILKMLLVENNLRAKDLADILGVSKGLVSDILAYKKGLSKEIIRKLSEYFKVNQAAFNRTYQLYCRGVSPDILVEPSIP